MLEGYCSDLLHSARYVEVGLVLSTRILLDKFVLVIYGRRIFPSTRNGRSAAKKKKKKVHMINKFKMGILVYGRKWNNK